MKAAMRHCVAVFVIAMFAVTGVHAAEDAGAQFTAIDGAGMTGLMLNLLLVLAVIGVAGWLLSRGQRRLGGHADALKVVASRPLGSRERIMVVAVGDEHIVIGVTPQSINHLHTLAEPITAGWSADVEKNSFAERLQQLLVRKGRDS